MAEPSTGPTLTKLLFPKARPHQPALTNPTLTDPAPIRPTTKPSLKRPLSKPAPAHV